MESALDETTHRFRLTSKDDRLVLPQEISDALELRATRYTKDSQVFVELCVLRTEEKKWTDPNGADLRAVLDDF